MDNPKDFELILYQTSSDLEERNGDNLGFLTSNITNAKKLAEEYLRDYFCVKVQSRDQEEIEFIYQMTPTKKILYVCATCGSDKVTSDALATWDVEAQQWVLETTLQNSDCEVCEGSVHLKELNHA